MERLLPWTLPSPRRRAPALGGVWWRNIDGLFRDFIYPAEGGGNIAVDDRAILEALESARDAQRIVEEIAASRGTRQD